jgi:hypothetical protein
MNLEVLELLGLRYLQSFPPFQERQYFQLVLETL